MLALWLVLFCFESIACNNRAGGGGKLGVVAARTITYHGRHYQFACPADWKVHQGKTGINAAIIVATSPDARINDRSQVFFAIYDVVAHHEDVARFSAEVADKSVADIRQAIVYKKSLESTRSLQVAGQSVEERVFQEVPFSALRASTDEGIANSFPTTVRSFTVASPDGRWVIAATSVQVDDRYDTTVDQIFRSLRFVERATNISGWPQVPKEDPDVSGRR